jgi:splicing factor 3A subunit 3
MASTTTVTSTPNNSDDLDRCRQALHQATRRLEQARCQEAELEAWTVLGSTLLKAPPGHLVYNEQQIAGGIQDGLETVSQITQAGMASTPAPPPKTADTNSSNSNGQWATVVHRSVQAYSVQRMAEKAQSIVTNRLSEGPVLDESFRTLAQQPKDPNLWLQLLDERLVTLKTYHARHRHAAQQPALKKQRGNPAADGYDLGAAIQSSLNSLQNEETLFSPDEVLGKYLDLQTLYQQALHDELLSSSSTNHHHHYVDFLQSLAKGRLLLQEEQGGRGRRNNKKYLRFLTALQSYLEYFLQRTVPLLDLQQFRSSETATADDLKTTNIDLTVYTTADALATAVDADTLKNELARLGLKCGGTPLERAKRLFLLKEKSHDELPASVKQKTNNNNTLIRIETTVQALLDQVHPILEATIRRSERRQTQNLTEREREVQEELYGSKLVLTKANNGGDDDDDDDDAPIYNPKNVPLDWDGKPMPYWLFKLHGLQHYYTCEICGGESYRGRRNFELHFAENKHAAGMKNLQIPNTKHFHGVTKIQDAMSLWKSMQSKLNGEVEEEEEYEDSHGNVLSRSTYEDLARQGLL